MILAGDVFMGHDENCSEWLTYVRAIQAQQAAVGAAVGPAPAAAQTANANAATANASRDERAARREARRQKGS